MIVTLLASMPSFASEIKQIQPSHKTFKFRGLKTITHQGLAKAISQNLIYHDVEILSIEKSKNVLYQLIDYFFEVPIYTIKYKIDGESIITSNVEEWQVDEHLRFTSCDSDNDNVVIPRNTVTNSQRHICFFIDYQDISSN